MNGFPSVQYLTVCAFLISSWQKSTKQNAGLGPRAEVLTGMIRFPWHRHPAGPA
jgi:hypothetical protein